MFKPLFLSLLAMSFSLSADLMLVGIDEKMTWDEEGTLIKRSTDQNDRVAIYDIAENPLKPTLKANLKLINSIFGPPSNIAVSKDEKWAYVANSLKWIKINGEWGWEPNRELHIISLVGEPKHVKTIQVGLQPSGIDLRGDLLLVTNREENSISVLRVKGAEVEPLKKIDTIDSPAGVSISPDGKLALFIKKSVHKVGVLHISGHEVNYDASLDIHVGIEPYNVKISPVGNIALVNNIGFTNGNDGNVDSVSVIELEAKRPFVRDIIAVGDGPEGLSFNHDGSMAVAVLINGSHKAKADPNTAWAYHKNGAIAVMKITGKKVRKTQFIEVGGMPEGVVFSEKGDYLYIGNFKSKDLSIFKIENGKVIEKETRFVLEGAPATMARN